MGKLEKRATILAAGSLVIGALFMGAGVLAGGISDIKERYRDGNLISLRETLPSLDQIAIEVENVEVLVEVGDVTDVTVDYISFDGTHYPITFDTSKRKLTIKADPYETTRNQRIVEHVVRTDVLELFREWNTAGDYWANNRIRVIVPKDLEVKEIVGKLSSARLTVAEIAPKKMEVTGQDSEVVLDRTKIVSGEMNLNNGYFLSHSSHLVNLSAILKDSQADFDDEQITDSQISVENGYLSFHNVTYGGTVDISAVDSSVEMLPPKPSDKTQVEVTAIDGELINNWSLNGRYMERDARKEWIYVPESSQAMVRITSQTGDVYLNDDFDEK